MDELEFAKIIELITLRTGIIPRDSHITGIKNFINKRLKELEQRKRYLAVRHTQENGNRN